MRDWIDLKGASGAIYRFNLFKDGRPLSPMGGNFIYARETAGRVEVLYINEVQNLLKDAGNRWNEGVQTHQAEALYTRLNISERVRKQEHDDLAVGLTPPMNGPLPEQKKAG
jgi:hypothetical protein